MKEEAKEIARNILFKTAVRKNQVVMSINMEKVYESDSTNTSNVIEDVAEDIYGWASTVVVVEAENSEKFMNCGRSGVKKTL